MQDRAHKVDVIFRDCLFMDSELDHHGKPVDGIEPIVVPAIRATYGLHPGRVEQHRQEIIELTKGLQPGFYKGTGGGGWTFLNLCTDANGYQWGEHLNCEQLCVLAIAAGRAKWLGPCDLWKVFPGGMPYVVFEAVA